MTDSTQDIQQKLAYYRRKFELNPRSRLFAPLADLLRKSGQLDEALEVIQSGLLEHPRYVSALVILGRCQTDADSWAAAKDAFLRVLELDPDNLVALKYLADDAVRQEDWQEAVGLLERVIRLDPSDTTAENELAQLRIQLVAAVESATVQPLSESAAEHQDDHPERVVEAGVADPDPVDEGNEIVQAAKDDEVEVVTVSDEAAETESDDELPEDDGFLPFGHDELPYDAYTPPRVHQLESHPITAEIAETTDAIETVETTETNDTAETTATPRTNEIAEITETTETTASTETDAEPLETRFLATKTLADIYLSQGYRDKALAVLRQILARNPQRKDIQEQITKIENSPREVKKPAGASTEPATVSPVDNEVRRKYFESWIATISRQTEE